MEKSAAQFNDGSLKMMSANDSLESTGKDSGLVQTQQAIYTIPHSNGILHSAGVCDDSNMPRWFSKKSKESQEQPLVSQCSNQYEAYLEDSETNSFEQTHKEDGVCETHEEVKTRCCQNSKLSLYRGLFYSALSSVFFSLSSVIVKYAKNIDPGELAVIRFVGILIFTLPVVIYSREEIFGPRNMRHLLIFRGLVGATSLFLRFIAFRNLPIADASVIVFSIPVFVTVLARIFLKEPCGIFHSIAVLLTLIGIVLITRLPVIIVDHIANISKNYIYGVVGALGSTFFGASVYIVIRKMTKLHHSVIMFNFGWVAIIETVALTFATGKFTVPACGVEQWLVILLGIFSFCGQTLLTLALKEENAGPVSIIRAATDIIIAYFWQIWFFYEIPDVYSISGAILVSSCVVLISVRKWVVSLPEHSVLKRKLQFLTL